MKQRILSAALALCVCVSAIPGTHAAYALSASPEDSELSADTLSPENTPNEPEDSEQSDHDESPEDPNTPEDGSNPEDTDTPVDGGNPEDTDTPEDSSNPEDTDTPEDGNNPEDPDTPEDSSNPEDTDTPGDGSNPEAPDTPEDSSNPEDTDTPEDSNNPEDTDTPEDGDKGEDADNPEAGDNVADADAPEADGTPEDPDASDLPTEDALPDPTEPIEDVSVLLEEVPQADGSIPTRQEVYDTITALKATYPDDMPWTDANQSYTWHGGPLANNVTGGTGCVAFAFRLSDEAFGELPARMSSKGQFSFSDVKPGDILRLDNASHTVIVLQVSENGVVIAEGNNNGKVVWGRALSKAEVEAADYYITRYPAGYIDPDDETAHEPVAGGSGSSSGGPDWTLTKGGTLTISGSLSDGDQPWKDYADKILSIVIEDGVTSISDSAFSESKALSATIPGSVTSIGSNAFEKSSLISVNISNGVTAIGDSAFRSCPNLSTVTVPDGVETIGSNAFRGSQKLTSVTLPASVTSVGAGSFCDCTELQSVTFADGCTAGLGDNLFSRCQNLAEAKLPQGLECIGKEMFMNCLSLTRVDIPQGVSTIKGSAFASCSRLSTLTIPDSVTSIDSAAFSNSGLKDIYFSGSEAQWKSISKSADVTAALANVTIHYNSTAPEPEKPGTDPTEPGTPGTDPAEPEKPGTDPTEPEKPGTDPEEPEAPDTTPSVPDRPTTVPETPASRPSSDASSDERPSAAPAEAFSVPETPAETVPAPTAFTDVSSEDAFQRSVDYVWEQGLMVGVSDTQFAPDAPASRATVWMILARLNNVSTAVQPGADWYHACMQWAMQQGISDGMNPAASISREQLAAMLWRAAGSPTPPAETLDGFTDSSLVSGYASAAVRWAVSCGILQDSDGQLQPQAPVTRAELAQMIMHYNSNI